MQSNAQGTFISWNFQISDNFQISIFLEFSIPDLRILKFPTIPNYSRILDY